MLSVLSEAVLTSTHNLYFEQKYEKYISFLSKNFQFLEGIFTIYLNRRVFVMHIRYSERTHPYYELVQGKNWETLSQKRVKIYKTDEGGDDYFRTS